MNYQDDNYDYDLDSYEYQQTAMLVRTDYWADRFLKPEAEQPRRYD